MSGYDPEEAARALALADRRLARVIERVGPPALPRGERLSPFAALLRAIVYQQLSGHAAARIHERLRALYPGARPGPRRVLATPEAALRGAGLSRPKVAAVRDLAAQTLSGVVPARARLEAMNDEAIIERLTAVRGVGRWTVEMVLIFDLGRPDVLPLDDLGVRKGFARHRGERKLPARERLRRHAERWRPWRSVASWYLWRACEL